MYIIRAEAETVSYRLHLNDQARANDWKRANVKTAKAIT